MPTRDLMYIYDKQTFKQSTLGEVQQGFDMSFVIDGTKDSAKIEVIGFDKTEIQPYTICYHPNTNSWWIVSNDKVESFRHEGGFIYRHILKLLGAVELLNARDLTDCGFNANRYSIKDYIDRLLKLSTFEFAHRTGLSYAIDSDDEILSMSKVVDYVKTFENYTLLSALREFLDGYNCALKMSFTNTEIGGELYLNQAILTIVSKSGKISTHYNTEFTDSREINTMDKESFGTSVISNAENVVSTKAKTYPSQGSMKLSAETYKVTLGDSLVDACLRLPSPVYKVNRVDIYSPMKFEAQISDNGGALYTQQSAFIDLSNKDKVYNAFYQTLLDIRDDANSLMSGNAKSETLEYIDNLIYDFDNSFEMLYQNIIAQMVLHIYDGFHYNPYANGDIGNQNYKDPFTPLDESKPFNIIKDANNDEYCFLLADKQTRNSIEQPRQCLYWEKGSNLIKGLECWYEMRYGASGTTIRKMTNSYKPFNFESESSYQSADNKLHFVFRVGYADSGQTVSAHDTTNSTEYMFYQSTYVVEYVPMTDLKIKYDNTQVSQDSQYYNQNGKLTDSVALSKLMLGYSKEIESDTITRYKNVYNYNECLRVGELVLLDNKQYVVTNVSLSFVQSENDGYYIEGEYTLTQNVATKSLLTNPNTNIRDYGIPQNYNVKRKQLYRDFYELGHTSENDNQNWYLPLEKVFNITYMPSQYQEHTAVIALTFNGAYGGGTMDDGEGGTKVVNPSDIWFYQLESTTYIMKKAVYEVIDFQDNNIIGYGTQNVWSGFDLKRILTANQTDIINTPISYVDDAGEFKGISIRFCTNEQIGKVYQDYLDSLGETYDGSLYNYSVFIPVNIFNGAYSYSDFQITDGNYNKDATEVPVFEYCCQIDDSEDVIVGSNILDNHINETAYLYSFVFTEKGKYNDNNFNVLLNQTHNPHISFPSIDSDNIATLDNAVELSYDTYNKKIIKVKLYSQIKYDLTNNVVISRGNAIDFDTTKDLTIIRHRIANEDTYFDLVGTLASLTIYTTLPQAISSYYGKYIISDDDNYHLCVPNVTATYVLENTDVHNYNVFVNIEENPQGNTYVGKYGTFKYPNISLYTEIANTNIYKQSTGMPSYPVTNGNYIVIQDTLPSKELWEIPAPNGPYGVKVTISHSTSGGRSAKLSWYTGVGYYLEDTIYNNQSTIIMGQNVADLSRIILERDDMSSGSLSVTIRIAVVNNNGVEVPNEYKPQELVISLPYDNPVYEMTETTHTTDFNKFKHPCPYLPVIYNWNGSYFVAGATVQNKQIFKLRNSPRFYQWVDNGTDTGIMNDYTSSVQTPLYVIATRSDNLSGFTTIITLNGGEKAKYGDLQYEFNISIGQWTLDTTAYKWQQVGSANDKKFLFNNLIYEYDADTNQLTQFSSDVGEIDRQDLIFVIRNMENANISSGTLTLAINYYKTN